jgi:hypothetical protein
MLYADFYDYGEELIYLGPKRKGRSGRRSSRLVDLVGFVACCPVYGFVIWKLAGH